MNEIYQNFFFNILDFASFFCFKYLFIIVIVSYIFFAEFEKSIITSKFESIYLKYKKDKTIFFILF